MLTEECDYWGINRSEALRQLALPVAVSAPKVLWGDVCLAVQGEGIIVQGLAAQAGALILC
jgi:hypothetical protein